MRPPAQTLIMNKIIRNNRLIAVAFITLFAGTAYAGDSTGAKPAPAVELSYAGQIRNDPVFRLSITGSTREDDYSISVTDSYGINLYRENIKTVNFTKNFLLNADELGDEVLFFGISSRKTGKTVVYEVSSRTKVVKDPAVSLIK